MAGEHPGMSDAELLATLRATPARPELPGFKPYEAARKHDALMRYFLFDYLLLKKPVRRGNVCGVPSIQVCSLYRLYLEWWKDDCTAMNPRQFSLAMGRAGIKRRRVFHQDEQSWLLVFIKEGSRRLIAWLKENPDPYGWPQEFAKQVGPGKHEATSPR